MESEKEEAMKLILSSWKDGVAIYEMGEVQLWEGGCPLDNQVKILSRTVKVWRGWGWRYLLYTGAFRLRQRLGREELRVLRCPSVWRADREEGPGKERGWSSPAGRRCTRGTFVLGAT